MHKADFVAKFIEQTQLKAKSLVLTEMEKSVLVKIVEEKQKLFDDGFGSRKCLPSLQSELESLNKDEIDTSKTIGREDNILDCKKEEVLQKLMVLNI